MTELAADTCPYQDTCGLLFSLHTCRQCYFTPESTNKRSDFMKLVNWSYKVGCLHCAFSDKELCDFIQKKKRSATSITKKYAVEDIGKQPDGTTTTLCTRFFNYTERVTE